MIDQRKQELKRLVTLGRDSIDPILKDLAGGLIRREDALERARNTIRRMTYDDPTGPNYLFMSSYEGVMLVQPYEKHLEGSAQWDLRDSRGIFIIRELVAAAKRGGGFVDYNYFVPGEGRSMQKISYVVPLDSLECYLGTGIYLDDISAYILEYILGGIAVQISILLLLMVATFVLLLPFYRSYSLVLARSRMILKDPDALSLPFKIPFRRGTEAWSFLSDFQAMLEQLDENRRSIRAARDSLEDSLREKEALLREIHHRVKNNLQIVISLLSLQGNVAKDDSVRAVLQESGARVRAMALIHELLYASETMQNVDLADYLREITSRLFLMYVPKDGKISLSFEMESMRIGLDSAILVGLIATELTTNSLKYAFPDNRQGTIRIGLSRSEGFATLELADDGIGFPENLLETQSNSLGLVLVKTLTIQLQGVMSFSGSSGAKFTLKFPNP